MPEPSDLLAANAQELRRALRNNQEDTNRFLMARGGMIPSEEFFNAENLQRIHSKFDGSSAPKG